jgi:hypothetical protein
MRWQLGPRNAECGTWKTERWFDHRFGEDMAAWLSRRPRQAREARAIVETPSLGLEEFVNKKLILVPKLPE